MIKKRKKLKKKLFLALILVLSVCMFIRAKPSAQEPTGTISGKVVELKNGLFIPGVSALIKDSKFTTISDQEGKFKFLEVPVGIYSIEFSIPGFKTSTKTDVVVHPNRISQINIEMMEEELRLEETVDVSASYFPEKAQNPNSTFNLSAEEIRRAPGSSGDISRMLKMMPGVSNLSDFNSDLIVRGGSPDENAFFIDNIEIPNINHFPTFGSSGGFFSAINPDLLRNVDFYTGGFSASYGDRLSSIIDMSFRDGNMDDFDILFSADFMQAGAVVEGPLVKGKGSFILSGRICVIRYLQDMGIIDFGEDTDFTFPDMKDSQARLTLDLSSNNRLTFLNYFSAGDFDLGQEEFNMDLNYTQNTAGLNLRTIWSSNLISNTTLSFSFVKQNFDMKYQFEADDFFWNYGTHEKTLSLRNTNYLELNDRNKIEFGLQLKRESFDQDWNIAAYSDFWGNDIQASSKKTEGFFSTKTGLFLSYIATPFKRLSTTFGFRGDYSSITDKFFVSPRFSFKYKFNGNFSLHGGTGIFFQSLPLYVQAENTAFRKLKEAKAIHYILGLEYLIGLGIRFSLEVYHKEYANLPIDPNNPRRLITDRDSFTLYFPPEDLVDKGKASSRGIELFIQKKMIKRLYGIFSFSYFKSRYKDLFGVERNRIYDNRYTLNLVLGYKPSIRWEFSTKWTMIGGAPYTPIDIQESIKEGTDVRDDSQLNGARYPDYNSLNLRGEYRLSLSKFGMIVFVDITNVLNRKNVMYYFWNPDENEVNNITQMPFFPKIGLEFRF